jgi:hypothetical protein
LLVAMVFNLGLLAYAMYALLGTMLVGRLLARQWSEGLAASRECNRLTANIGDTVAVVIISENRGKLPVACGFSWKTFWPARACRLRPGWRSRGGDCN